MHKRQVMSDELIDSIVAISMERLNMQAKISMLVEQISELHDDFEKVNVHLQAAQNDIEELTGKNVLAMRLINELLDLVDKLKAKHSTKGNK
jgi:hypothetical protein